MGDPRLKIFAEIFMLSNRLTNACEKIQKDISIKQWLLLAICMKSKERLNFTELGNLMGCSRQNCKKLALQLEKKSFVKIQQGKERSQYIEILEKAHAYGESMQERHTETIHLLFSDFDVTDLSVFSKFMDKLEKGIERLEEYSNEGD